jgi:hypothetical protein
MARTKEAEVPTIQRSQFRFTHALHDGQDRGVDEADVGVHVAAAEVANAWVLLHTDFGYGKRTAIDVVEKRNEYRWTDSSEVSVWPDAAAPKMVGRGGRASTFASRASRITVARDTRRRLASSWRRANRSSGAIIVVRRMHNYASAESP